MPRAEVEDKQSFAEERERERVLLFGVASKQESVGASFAISSIHSFIECKALYALPLERRVRAMVCAEAPSLSLDSLRY